MPTARIFASLAEAAGTREISFDAATLGEFLDRACAMYGDVFARQLDHCRIVVNSEAVPLDRDLTITDGDEIAILPPVAGGELRSARRS